MTVVGDSLASQISDGLQEAFSDRPEISIHWRGRESSGLVRSDYYDWAKSALDIVVSDKPDVIVIVIGSNDLQSFRDDSQNAEPLSDRWKALYSQRVNGFVEPLRAAAPAVVWLGLPPMRSEAYNSDMAKLNELDHQLLETMGVKFVDLWEAFSSNDGSYDAFGPDINGQTAKLRASDGIHFTKAGARKAAGFVESDIRRAFETSTPRNEIAALPPDIEQAAIDINAQIRREAGISPRIPAAEATSAAKPEAGPIFSLTETPTAPDAALATRRYGANLSTASNPVTPVTLTNDVGARRSDDFSWPHS